jgi:hypothetical protein
MANCSVNNISEMPGLNYFNLSPNPANGIVNISAGFSSNKTVDFVVKNITGQAIFSREISGQILEEQIDLSHQPGGLYFVEMTSSGNRIVEKLILNK